MERNSISNRISILIAKSVTRICNAFGFVALDSFMPKFWSNVVLVRIQLIQLEIHGQRRLQ